MKEITVKELKSKIDSGENPVILDVREFAEVQAGKISDFHIPMGEIANNLDKLNPYKNNEIIVYCRGGKRSAAITQFLETQGFANVNNLRGGITSWKQEIDPKITVA